MNKKETIALKKVLTACNCMKCPYSKAYHILMEYWDSLPDEEKLNIDRKLKRLGL